MKRVLLMAIILSAGCREAPEAQPQDASQAVALPSEADLLSSRCTICHSLDYVSQQRLTAAQWEKTVFKMQKWGAPLSEAEAKFLAGSLAAKFVPDLPDGEPKLVPPPTGASP